MTLNHIARWDGRSWTPLDGGMDTTVFSLAVSDATGEAYAGGAFAQAVNPPSSAAVETPRLNVMRCLRGGRAGQPPLPQESRPL